MHDASFLIELSAKQPPLRDQLRWIRVHTDDGKEFAIVPAKVQPFLYRGQNRRYAPCWPSICRDFSSDAARVHELCPSDQLLFIKRLAQGRWFEQCLDSHPTVQWASQDKLRINRTAIAQHYGIPTGYVDLTESFDVAAFFATCYFDRASKSWRPCETGDGVLYVLNWMQLPPEPKRVRWIGLHPLPRPAEQWGWTCELFLGEDFEQAPSLQGLRFSHSSKAGAHFLHKFADGALLFPSDPLARVADRINHSSCLPLWALSDTIADLIEDEWGLPNSTEQELFEEIESKLGITVDANCASPIHQDDIDELHAIWNARKGDFLKGVGIQLVRTPKTPPAEP